MNAPARRPPDPVPGLRVDLPDDLAHEIFWLLDELDGRQGLDGEHRDDEPCGTCTAQYELGQRIRAAHAAHAAALAIDNER